MRWRRLPHLADSDIDPKIPCWFFLTWRLAGSLPAGRYFDEAAKICTSDGAAFAAFDRLLDEGGGGRHGGGPVFLGVPEVAEAVREEICLGFLEMAAWVIMPNHVHVLAEVAVGGLSETLRRVKGRSARRCNLILGSTGRPFWQAESYDRCVRDAVEFERVWRYVERNPVKAGLVERVEDFRWSSAFGLKRI
jgi:putative transposase